jgi:hypothetical protein
VPPHLAHLPGLSFTCESLTTGLLPSAPLPKTYQRAFLWLTLAVAVPAAFGSRSRRPQRRLRAERRGGELLIDMAERNERHAGKAAKGLRVATPTTVPKLADLGVNKTQSSRWQATARLAADVFESKIITPAVQRAYDNLVRRRRLAADSAFASQAGAPVDAPPGGSAPLHA